MYDVHFETKIQFKYVNTKKFVIRYINMHKQTLHYHKFENDKYVGSVKNTYRGKILMRCFINTYSYQEYPLFFIYVHSTLKKILRRLEDQKQCKNKYMDKLGHRLPE